jgi:hypothetical protein
MGIFHGIFPVPLNIVMDLNNVMLYINVILLLGKCWLVIGV